MAIFNKVHFAHEMAVNMAKLIPKNIQPAYCTFPQKEVNRLFLYFRRAKKQRNKCKILKI